MRVALLSDIHGNALALEAVLGEIQSERVDAVMNLGDIFYGPLWPRRTWDLLRTLNAVTIVGNEDRELFDATAEQIARHATVAYNIRDLGEEPIEWMRALPATTRVDQIYACHGTPDSDLIYLLENISSGDAQLLDEAEIKARLGARRDCVIVCGHSHTPRALTLSDGTLIVNPGSVGLPAYDDTLPVPHRMQTGTPHARWALLEKTPQGWRAQLRSTAYDHESAARQAEAQQRPDWAGWLRTGLATIPAR
ncbi:MAG: putative phosphoesterase [Hydrocarboniphaga sp.]|uniref:metallophosphoesterase family protein n=1 Tax=Hydrocarboniphaga sp. TaxID=2033016 RepID=UPI00261EAEBC|nr:metallophosphoesterase family protein [Hydrocarboniphaga sp.]MDB5967772.1 putative phosphoesterase [Hydrocarboniphaga sp.]